MDKPSAEAVKEASEFAANIVVGNCGCDCGPICDKAKGKIHIAIADMRAANDRSNALQARLSLTEKVVEAAKDFIAGEGFVGHTSRRERLVNLLAALPTTQERGGIVKRKDNYLVGFAGKNQVVYGRIRADGSAEWAVPMTLAEARKEVFALHKDKNDTRRIFKLVPVSRPIDCPCRRSPSRTGRGRKGR